MVKQKLENFLDFKKQNSSSAYNNFDRRFSTDTPLCDYRHFHVIHGKIIVVYLADKTHIELYAIGDHNMYEGSRVIALNNYIKSLTQGDFDEFVYGVQPKVFTAEQFDEIEEFIYSLIPTDIDLLKEYLKLNNYGMFYDMMLDTLDVQTNEDIDSFKKQWKQKFKMSFDNYIKQAIQGY